MNPLARLIAYLAPYDCLGCGAEGDLLCMWCRSSLPHVQSRCYRCLAPRARGTVCPPCRTALAATLARTPYDQLVVRRLLFKLKEDRAQSVAAELAEMMAPLLRHASRDTIITHAPTSTLRVRRRGYDQAQLIARHLARCSGLPYRRLLLRTGHTKQVGSDRRARQSQLQTAFHVTAARAVAGRPIVIVDDVMTTGATLETAAKVLIDAGAGEVTALVFAAAQKLL